MKINNKEKIKKAKDILGKLSILFIFILIITNAVLFKLYVESEKKHEVIQGIVDSPYYNITNNNISFNSVKNYIIKECGGYAVEYRTKTEDMEEQLVCLTSNISS